MFGLGWQEVLLVLIIGAVIYGLFFSPPVRRRLTAEPRPKQPAVAPPLGESAEEILDRRFARGEIDRNEYETMRAAIHQNRT